jgi:hypothetical protein
VKRFFRTLVVLGTAGLAACSESSVTGPGDLDGITRIVLRAWEDTRAGLPPLAVTREDSVALVVNFINTRRDKWETVQGDLPGNPLFAELRRGNAVVSRFGFIEISHGAGGYFITTDGGKNQLRPATAEELASFLAFFGISVEIVGCCQ